MDMIGKVRRMKLRDQLSLSEIAKRTGLSRNTVKKWLKASATARMKRRGGSKHERPAARKQPGKAVQPASLCKKGPRLTARKQPWTGQKKEVLPRRTAYSYSQLAFAKAALAPSQYSIGTGGQDCIGPNRPEPLEVRTSTIDYDHYLSKQLQPIADAILVPLGDSFTALISPQKYLF